MSLRWLYGTNELGSGALWLTEEEARLAGVRALEVPDATVLALAARPRWWVRRRPVAIDGGLVVVLLCGDWSEIYHGGRQLGWARTRQLRSLG